MSKKEKKKSLSLFSQELKVLQKVVQIGEFFSGGTEQLQEVGEEAKDSLEKTTEILDSRNMRWQNSWKNCFSSWN